MCKKLNVYRLSILTSIFFSIQISTGCVCQQQHCRVQQNEPELLRPTAYVTGLVTNPRVVEIPETGLQLRDALKLAGGDVHPIPIFDNISPLALLVTLERNDGTYHFSLPLVTNYEVGSIYLRNGDRISVQWWNRTPLGNGLNNTNSPPPGYEKTKDPNDPDEIDYLRPSVPWLTDYPGVLKPYLTDAVELKADFFFALRSSITDAKKTEKASYDLPKKVPLMNSYLTGEGRTFNDVFVLKRRIGVRELHQFIIPIKEPIGWQEDDPYLKAMLDSVIILPGDELDILPRNRVPIILANLLAPLIQNIPDTPQQKTKHQEWHERMQQQKEQRHNTLRNLAAPLAPVGRFIHRTRDAIAAPIHAGAQRISEAVPQP